VMPAANGTVSVLNDGFRYQLTPVGSPALPAELNGQF
jgi:hypothetical protein